MSLYQQFFIEKVGPLISNDSSILEIGCGNRSFFEELEFKNILAIDKSLDLILEAPESEIKYQAEDVVSINYKNQFDLIFDSHAIHCILDPEKRELAFRNIYEALKSDGYFISEIMVKKKSSDPYSLFPERFIKSTFEVEDELIRNNFKIKYFFISPDLYFLDDVSLKNKCDVLRFIAQK